MYFLFEYRTTIISNDFDLLEGLTSGHFDAKNKLVRSSFCFFINIKFNFIAFTNCF